MRIALDTNILVYAEGLGDDVRRDRILSLLEQLATEDTVIPTQVLGELFTVLVRKANRKSADAQAAILSWRDAYPTTETNEAVLLAATELAVHHHFNIWDAVILAAAAQAGCRLLLSEDMHEGFTWNGVTITNPFAVTLHPLLASVLPA